MKQFFVFGVLCVLVCVTLSQVPGYEEAVRNVKKAHRLTDDEAEQMVNIMQKRLQYLEKTGRIKDWDTPLVKASQCPPLMAVNATDNIYELKPGHVSIVASMGDSITAAFAASSSSLIGVKEWRGQSWSIGGDESETTFPNTLVEFVGDAGLYGPSLGTGNREENPYDYLNGAVSGAVVQDMPGQAEWLVQHLTALGPEIFQNEWKVITIWIGGNNLCDVCNDVDGNSPDVYETKLNEALLILSTIPRTFVNVVPSLDVTELSRFSAGMCRLLHPFECRCATSSEENKAIVKKTNAEYTERIKKLSAAWTARNSTDFAVVVQPFLVNTQIPDETYLSSADCFHPSKKAHQAIAVALWNSMIVPYEQKALEWVPGEPIVCPTEETKFWVN